MLMKQIMNRTDKWAVVLTAYYFLKCGWNICIILLGQCESNILDRQQKGCKTMKKQQKCYIYTRVSTSMQVDGYSLDAQKDKLHKYADYQDMIIAGEYSDEGKSGKSVEGRPQFQQMLQDIESGKDNVDYVLVFKLSRFGRNAADALSSL